MTGRLEHMLKRPISKGGTPAHVQVQERVIAVIQEGLVKPGGRLPSEPELAEGLGVSRMTANKALLALADQGWVSRQKGRGTYVLSRQQQLSKFTLELIVGDNLELAIENYYFGALYFGVQSAASEQRVPVHCRSLNSILESEEELEADGVIVINPPLGSLERLRSALARCRSKMILGAGWPGFQVPCIDSDNILGAALAVGHLADLGHRDLMLITACPDDANTSDRIRGFDLACTIKGCRAVRPPLVAKEALGLELELIEEFVRVMKGQERPTALFVAGAILALQVSRLVQQIGLSIPDDVSIVAYDDPGFLTTSYPPLDTIRQPLGEMGKTAFQMLIRSLEEGVAPPLQTVLPPELIVRGSVVSPRPPSEKHK